jgi:hypothetical protein
VIGLAPSHFLCQQRDKFTVTQVVFKQQVQQLSGKKKKGSQIVHPTDVLCEITYTCQGGESRSLSLCGFGKGKLLETNERLLRQPHMIQHKPMVMGYVAIIDPNGIFKIPQDVDNMLLNDQNMIHLEQFKSTRFSST